MSKLIVPGHDDSRDDNLFKIGHSNHTAEHFCGLLHQHGIDVLVDVRSQPYSQYSPQFNREPLRDSIVASGFQYLFLGEEGGATVEVFTIGFTQTTAAEFFGRLKKYGIRRLVDVRLNNVSQLAGFAKRDDLSFFLREICGAEYLHETLLAPTQDMLDAYKKLKGSWKEYEKVFLELMAQRRIEERLDPDLFAVPAALLCSEPAATHCHRRLVAEYLDEKWHGVKSVHL